MSDTATSMSRTNRITFISPDGADTVAPNPESLRDLIMNAGDDYWQYGSGDAALLYDRDDGARVRLILMEDETAGFFLLYEDPETGEYLHPKGSDPGDETITISMGGEPMDVSAQNFVAKDKAWEVVEFFMRDGERAPVPEWKIWE